MRSVVPVAAPALLFALVVITCPMRAFSASFDDKHPDAQSIAALETKASQAGPREQCFLYAELVHAMIEYSTEQYAAGEYQKAADTLKRVNGFAQKIHIAVANDEKRLKNAQILIRGYMRLDVGITRPKAFTKLTGITLLRAAARKAA